MADVADNSIFAFADRIPVRPPVAVATAAGVLERPAIAQSILELILAMVAGPQPLRLRAS
jgi:hypothetical protein